METCLKLLAIWCTVFVSGFPVQLNAQWIQSGVTMVDTIPIGDSLFISNRSILHKKNITLYQSQLAKILPDSSYLILGDHIYILHPEQFSEPILVIYPALTDSLTAIQTWLDTSLIQSEYLIKSLPNDLAYGARYPQWSNLTYSGQFGRGIQIGNTQNATLQSNFDLQINGLLPNGIKVTGSLSDNSIPLQPEGNSLQLQEFDKVFIQLEKPGLKLVAGDHEITDNRHYFMRYYKKTKGLFVASNAELDNGWSHSSSANFSISKGKFKRITLSVEEGNQGPYRLSTEASQLFAVVLAGTEKVYLDGELLTRGELNQYTIDYNLGEITFTSKTYVGVNSRIIVEYEFAEQNYLRSLLTGHSTWTKNKFSVALDIYSEQDGKNSFQNDLLTPENEQIIADVGDQVDAINGSSIIPWNDGYQEGIVLYHLVDSLGYDNILLLAKNGQSPLYTANFSYVGENNGNYIKSNDFSNGDIFTWIAPNMNGSPAGNYQPITKLQAPQIKQMMTMRGERNWDNGSKIYSEWALSKYDLNRFSDLDSENDVGLAQSTGFEWRKDLDSTGQKSWLVMGKYEWQGKNFTSITPYRSIEFQRDWNLDPADTSANESFAFVSATYNSKIWVIKYALQQFKAKNNYTGLQNQINIDWKNQKWLANAETKLLNSSGRTQRSNFLRPKINLAWQKDENRSWSIYTGYEGEYNAVKSIVTDSLIQSSIRFDRWYLKSRWQDKHEIQYSHRIDYSIQTPAFQKAYLTDDINISSTLHTGESNSLQLNTTFRHISLQSTDADYLKDQRGWNILGQLQFFQTIKKWGLQSNGDLSIGNGKEPRRSFQYIKVESGNGQYKYVDLNNDSIQQLNEFFPAIYQDEKNYIRVNIVQNELISTFNYAFNASVKIKMKDFTSNKFWSLFLLDNSIRVDNKQQRLANIKIINIPDTALISSQINVLNNLYINRNGKVLQQHFGHWFRSQKSFLNYGFEQFITRDVFSKSNFRLNKSLQTLLESSLKKTTQVTDNFTERNFIIHFWDTKNTVKWLIHQKMQLELQNGLIKASTTDQSDQSLTWKNKLSWNFVPNIKWNLQAGLDYSIVQHEYQTLNLSLEQVLLDGLRAGQNFLWEANVQRKLPNGLVISLRYNGRKIGDGSVVHNGTMQANLLF